MLRKTLLRLITIGFLISMLVVTACSAGSPAKAQPNISTPPGGTTTPPQAPVTPPKSNNQRIKATWIEPGKEGDYLTISVIELNKDTIIHFALDTPDGGMPFMAYVFGGNTYVRANICVPCRSYNFSLQKDILICDTCGTQFSAKTGEGISGPCIKYPKAAVNWETKGDNIIVKNGDLTAAFFNTLSPGLP